MPQISKAWCNELQFQLHACTLQDLQETHEAKFAGNVSLWLHFVSNKISI